MLNHPHDTPPVPLVHDAGLVDLEHEIAATPSDQLLEAVSLLIELPPTMQAMCWSRLRLTLRELQRRAGELAGAA